MMLMELSIQLTDILMEKITRLIWIQTILTVEKIPFEFSCLELRLDFARPDLPKGYGGWQALDFTPQEQSDGIFK